MDADGPVPNGLSARASALAADATVPLGTTESYPIPGVTTLVRVEPQAWTRDAQGNFAAGCYRVGAVYLPAGSPAIAAPTDSGLNRTVGVLTAVSLAVGAVASIAAWKRGKS